MRPPRTDIAAPELPPGLSWLGGDPGSMAALTATGPVLVHFFEFAQLNSVRSLPYVLEWRRRYEGHGLTTLGVQAPRFPFGFDRAVVAAGLERLGVEHPVAVDGERELWQDYGCTGWPSLFLWGRGGVLRWVHFGEGEYRATELAIQEQLREEEPLLELPEPMAPLRGTDADGARVMPPSEELYPGGSPDRPLTGEPVELGYEGGGAFAALEGRGELEVRLDGGPPRTVEVPGAGLYKLAEHSFHESHRIAIRPGPGISLWSVSFAAGVPGAAPGSAGG